MKHTLLATHPLGSWAVFYLQPEGTRRCELEILPADRAAERRDARGLITGRPEIDHLPEHFRTVHGRTASSLVQVKLAEDPAAGGFSQGVTLTESPTTAALEFAGQEVVQEGATTRITTTLRDAAGRFRCLHHLSHTGDERGLRCHTEFINDSSGPLSLELLTSLSLNGLSPFSPGNTTRRLVLHRFRSWWSAEGRMESIPLEDLHLERSWTGHGAPSERFGQVGTMPVRQWFPTAAVEDRASGVVWAVQLAWSGSWQIELTRSGDRTNLSAGLADREFGHWLKRIAPGETLTTPEARISALTGTPDQALQAVASLQHRHGGTFPAAEEGLPPVFNEWCTSWGSPTHDNILAIARRLQDTGVRYIVIDDGWAVRPPDIAFQANGDWNVDESKFPGGLRPTCDALRALGFIPGIWFEFEVVNPGSRAWNETAHLLHRDGRPLQVGTRRFWDFTDPWVHDYLGQKVIRLLQDNGIGYLKVDYNDTIGIGNDHADSFGEGLRRHVEGIHRFFRRIRDEVPGIVIENCSSGGHRLEPAMQELTAMGSFSDAHETRSIPIIARNLQRLILPRQSLIWAVLHAQDSPQRLVYSLAATFLGRMCLSGDIHALDDARMELVRQATALYARCAPLIENGTSHFHGSGETSGDEPRGWQAVVRHQGRFLLVVVHHFEPVSPRCLTIPLPEFGGWWIADQLIDPASHAEWVGDCIHYTPGGPFSGAVFLLQR